MATKKAASAPVKALSKNGLIQAITDAVGEEEVSRKQTKAVLEALVELGHKELKKNKLFTMPGFGKFKVVAKPAKKARVGKNPFTGETQTFAAKPASKSVRVRPIKAIKDAVA